MSTPNPQGQFSILDKFGLMLGAVTAFLGTMPLYLHTYNYFRELVLKYADYSSYWAWDLAWKICLFFFILTATWFALVLVINVLKGLLISLVVLLKRGNR